MKKIILLLLSFLTLTGMAQTTQKSLRQPTLDDLMWGGSNYWNLQPKSVFTAWWGEALLRTDVEQVSQLSDAAGRHFDAKGTPLFTLAEVNAALDTARCGVMRSLTSATFPEAGRPVATLRTARALFRYNWKDRRVEWSIPLERGIEHQDFAPASQALAYTQNYNLYVTTADGRRHAVSTDGNRELLYGTSVHRDEFGIHKGTFWSPDGRRLAFYRMDQRMVTDYPLVNIDVPSAVRIAQPAPEKYPMAGMTSHKVTVGIFNPENDRTVWLDLGDPTDRYFTNLSWSPDGNRLYIMEVPRSQKRCDLVAYDTHTGARLGVLYTETNERFVEPQNPLTFLPWDKDKFIYQSERDGFNHLYLFNTKGQLLKQLTSGKFEVLELLGFNTRTRSVIIRSNESGHIRENLYTVDIKTGRRTLLDNGVGVHRAQLSPNGTLLRDTWSSPTTYRNIVVRSTEHPREALRLLEAADPWREFTMPRVESGSILAADGKTPLYYRLVKPVHFDPNKQYPTIVYVYGGPHATNVKESWNYQARPWEYYMANRDYVLFILDNRGSGDRGFEFESCTHRHLGRIEMADQMQGVKYLSSLPFVDTTRIGVHGWSFGGFMTTNLMLSHPEVFKVGVAGGPVLDWKYYEAMYGERYMETPQTNPEGYAEASMVGHAGQLKGRLQIIVGYNDPTCVLQHSLAFLRACEDAGTQPDYFVYPGQGHNMMGRDMIHLHERITRYFEDHLKPLRK